MEKLDASASNPRRMFSVVNSLLGKNLEPAILPKVDNQTAADMLNSYFVNKVKTIRDEFSETAATGAEVSHRVFSGPAPLSQFQPVTEDQLLKIIKRCNPTSSSVDHIPTNIVIHNLDLLLPILVKIVNTSLCSSSVAKQFKVAVIKPLFKKINLDPSQCKSYRPVSNLLFASKLVERVVAKQLSSHLNCHGILDRFQSAYRPKHSCETALLRLVNDLLCSADAGNLMLLQLDLSAAFDLIDHDLL